MKHYNVVAAVVCHEGKFLCMQKGTTKYNYTTHKFEFPGGKIEAGETPQEALRRELMEEMNYRIEVGRKLVTVEHSYPDFSITMTAYLCTPLSPTFTLKEHIAYEWRTKEELMGLDWAAADIGIVQRVIAAEGASH